MNNLKETIHNLYSTLPKEQVLRIALDVCVQQMNKVNQIIELNELNGNSLNKMLNLRKAALYPIISEGILELQKGSFNSPKIQFAKIHTELLLELLESEYLDDLENGNVSTQERIINDIFTPNYLIEWSLNNLLVAQNDLNDINLESQEVIEINGVKWINRNLGSNQPEEFGNYYTWEESLQSCPNNWRLPSEEELKSLISSDSIWTTINGITGRLFGTSPNQIFLPAAGYNWNNVSYREIGTDGKYWSSSINSSIGNGYPRLMAFNNKSINTDSGNNSHKRTVRCVTD